MTLVIPITITTVMTLFLHRLPLKIPLMFHCQYARQRLQKKKKTTIPTTQHILLHFAPSSHTPLHICTQVNIARVHNFKVAQKKTTVPVGARVGAHSITGQA